MKVLLQRSDGLKPIVHPQVSIILFCIAPLFRAGIIVTKFYWALAQGLRFLAKANYILLHSTP